jgi:hypothetical protein
LLNFPQDIFAFSGNEVSEETQRIRDIEADIKEKEIEKAQKDFQWGTYLIGNENLWDFIKALSEQESLTLTKIIQNYESKKQWKELEVQNAEQTGEYLEGKQRELYYMKRDFYTDLLPYIAPKKLEKFKQYISYDVEYNEKSKQIGVEIQSLETQKREKIEQYEEDAEEFNEQIQEKIEAIAYPVFENFVQNEKFQKLTNNNKKVVFEKMKEKINVMLENQNITSLRRTILETLSDILDDFIARFDS